MRWLEALRSRRLLVLVACSALALVGFRDPGCGGGSERAGANGPCTRTKDCDPGLRCVEGVCVPEDAGLPDAGLPEASSDASTDAGSDAGGDL